MDSTKPLIPVTEWTHPNWDMKIILPDDGSRGKPQDYVDTDYDAAHLEAAKRYAMTLEQLDALPEWDG